VRFGSQIAIDPSPTVPGNIRSGAQPFSISA